MAQRTEPAQANGPWQPPPAPVHKRLYRRTDDKMIAGVASGLADYFNIDPVLVRIGFVLLAVLGGAGVLAYLVMWWIVPPTHEVSNAGENAIRRLKAAPTWVAVGLLVIGGLLLVNQLGPRHDDLVWGLGLIALGALLFWHTSQRTDGEVTTTAPLTPAPPPPPAAYRAPATGPTEPYAAAAAEPYAAAATTASFAPTAPPVTVPPTTGAPTGRFGEATYQPTQVPPPPRRRRERSGLGLATLGVAFLAVGVAALLDNWGVIALSFSQYLALGLLVLAIGMLIGAWFGRAKWLAWPALLLVPFVLLASLVTVPFRGGFGERTATPAAIAGGQATYRLVAGNLEVDLTQLDLTAPGSATPVHVTASVVAGTLRVVVPEGMLVHVDGSVGAGAMYLMGRYDDGLKVVRSAGVPAESAQMDLDLAVSFGRIIVAREVTGGSVAPKPIPAKPTVPLPPDKPNEKTAAPAGA